MALIYKTKDDLITANDPIINATPYIYNLSHSVGEGGANQKMDVLLVQNLLNIVYSRKHLKPDGNCGHKTVALIKDFQTTLKNRSSGIYIKTDNRLDPIHNHRTFTPSGLFIYGIFTLNGVARLTDWRRYLGVIAHIHLNNNENLTNEFIDYYAKVNMPAPAAFCQVKNFFN